MKKTVKIMSLVLAAILLSAVIAIAAGAKDPVSFTDVGTDRWSYGDIVYAVEHGFVNGVGEGRFAPGEACTRAMVVTVLYRAAGEPRVTFKPVFTDVKEGKWYSSAVIWAHLKGIVKGTTATTFEPDAKVTREQLSAFFYRYASFKMYRMEPGEDLSKFKDRDTISSYALNPIKWAVEIGLIKGMTSDTIGPRGFATREQFAAIMVRFDKHKFVVDSGVELPEVPIG